MQRRPPGALSTIIGPLEEEDFSEDYDTDDDTNDSDADADKDDQPPEANLADPLLLSPPTDDDLRVLWAEVVYGSVGWSRRFPNYPRRNQVKEHAPSDEKMDVPLQSQANTSETTRPDKERALCLDAAASTMPPHEERILAVPSIPADDASCTALHLIQASLPSKATVSEEGIVLFDPDRSGHFETISVLGKRQRTSADEPEVVRIRRDVQSPSFKRQRINVPNAEVPASPPISPPMETDNVHTQETLFTAPSSTPLDRAPPADSAGPVIAGHKTPDAQAIFSNRNINTVLDTESFRITLPSSSEPQCIESSVRLNSENQTDERQGHGSSIAKQNMDSYADKMRAAPMKFLARMSGISKKRTAVIADQPLSSRRLNPVVNAEHDQERPSMKQKRQDVDADPVSGTKSIHPLERSTTKRQRIHSTIRSTAQHGRGRNSRI
ncbi:uncharacterized protein LAESUDRAFT_757041 [Laetiporus sulphureus 93-53]|uniref:Uncharacterized protein n=1 Tax=Laetiporus sulphureus 93-53 TaxID=1314785 RepID=A0A165FES1_9APHY|nr:uncharacterized protein LAESUDRAFT_757041 [Laetiporus sulphureus 93-53]KZT08860.1 hypothetical protein LAESUDRAFT_757041 [Laetiporus sulphureus 93-53]